MGYKFQDVADSSFNSSAPSRAEESRQFHEMTKFFERHPELKCTANAHVLKNWAEENGGQELISCEWLELQIDALKGKLAVLSETPDQALADFFAENPGLDFESNKQRLRSHLKGNQINSRTIAEAVYELGSALAFNASVQEEHTATQEAAQLAQERDALVDEIIQDSGSREDVRATIGKRERLQREPIETLRTAVQQIRDAKRFRGMSAYELKAHIRQQQEQTAPVAPGLPAEFTVEKIRSLEPQKIKRLAQRYSWEAINERLGAL